MIKVKVYNLAGKEVEEINLDSSIFEVEANPALIHQVVKAQRANARFKLAHTKTKGEVRGGGKKPWKQKGTGRARHGSIRSPLWRGGGVIFGPRKERDYTQKINKKMKRKALYMSLSDKVKENNLIVVDNLTLPKIKTKDFINILKKLPLKKSISTLVVLPGRDEILTKSVRNLPKVKTILASSLNVIDVLQYNSLLVDKKSLNKLVETYKQ